jgi:hypothetical protein
MQEFTHIRQYDKETALAYYGRLTGICNIGYRGKPGTGQSEEEEEILNMRDCEKIPLTGLYHFIEGKLDAGGINIFIEGHHTNAIISKVSSQGFLVIFRLNAGKISVTLAIHLGLG